MIIRYTNFDGDWDTDCTFCGEPQRSHQTDLGELEGIQYIHRLPCLAEKKHITRRAIFDANAIRVKLSLYGLAVYLWSKIPFLAELKLLLPILRRIYIGIRGILYYLFKYRS